MSQSCSWLLARLHHQCLVDVGDHTTASNGGLDQGVKLLVAADRQLQVAGSDALDFQVLACVASELENLGREVLKDRGSVNCISSADTAVRADSALQKSVDSSNRELKQNQYVSDLSFHDLLAIVVFV